MDLRAVFAHFSLRKYLPEFYGVKIRQNYEFSLPLVCKHFIGFIPSSVIGNPERRIYEKMYDRLRKAKQIIAKEEKGEWKTTDGDEGWAIYTFIK